MATRKKEQLSAQIVLRSASGSAPGPQTAVTSANVHEYLPAAADADAARRAYREAGFEVGEVVGNSFSITAPAATFEKVFKVKLRRDESKGVRALAATGGDETYELPIDKLKGELARNVAAATFSPPPDFGPTSYY